MNHCSQDAQPGKEIWRYRNDRFHQTIKEWSRGTPPGWRNGLRFGLKARWRRSTQRRKENLGPRRQKELAGKVPIWGFSSSPLIWANLIFHRRIGKQAIVAVNKNTCAMHGFARRRTRLLVSACSDIKGYGKSLCSAEQSCCPYLPGWQTYGALTENGWFVLRPFFRAGDKSSYHCL